MNEQILDYTPASVAAEYMCVHAKYISQMARQGRIPAIRRGSSWYILTEAMKSYVKGSRKNGVVKE